MDKTTVTLKDVREAAERIKPYIYHTPLLKNKSLDEVLGCQAYLKPEMLQTTGAFKVRGALNKVLSMSQEQLNNGIVTSSSGNHAQACAYVGKMMGIRTTVVVPEDTPTIKIENARTMGANVIIWDRNYEERWKKVRAEVEEHGYTIVHAYEDYTVMAGQGTIALEIMNDLPDVNTVIVPIGGGGLISGISTAIKESNQNVRVIGVQAAASCAYYVSRQNGKPTGAPCLPTIADGLSCRNPGNNPYPIIEKYVDDIVVVEENEIEEALRIVASKAKLIAEPSACVGVAALMANKVTTRPDEKVCFVLTAGNWDIDRIGRILIGEHVKGVL